MNTTSKKDFYAFIDFGEIWFIPDTHRPSSSSSMHFPTFSCLLFLILLFFKSQRDSIHFKHNWIRHYHLRFSYIYAKIVFYPKHCVEMLQGKVYLSFLLISYENQNKWQLVWVINFSSKYCQHWKILHIVGIYKKL